MISKIVSLISGLFGDKLGIILKVVSYVAIFAAGAYAAYLYYDHKIQEIEIKSMKAVSDIKSQSIIELQNREKETAKIISERDNEKAKHDADVRELNDLINKLQLNASRSSKSVLAASSSSTKSTEELLTRGRELQERCYKLLERGVDLSGRISADKDTVVKMTTQNGPK